MMSVNSISTKQTISKDGDWLDNVIALVVACVNDLSSEKISSRAVTFCEN